MMQTYDGIAYFDDWLETEGINLELALSMGQGLDMEELEDAFEAWCHENDLTPEYA